MAPQVIVELVEAFERNLESYSSPQYKEAEVRREYIDPFFEALGWDVQNRRKYAENYKDVVHEPSLEAESGSSAPDYSFQPGGRLKFYVEAKRPAVNLDREAAPAHQVRMYGWTKQLAISILTNFAEFAVYDCRFEPRAADSAAVARVLYVRYAEYLDRWEELVSLFSPEAVFRGSFDRFVETRKRRGASPFDERFLDDMEVWRKRLAGNLALRNEELSQRRLNYAVQQTIDRVIFLRICEARGIERFGRLRDLAALPSVYPNLVEYFRAADDTYNSGLFHFRREQGREAPDELTPVLNIDDGTLRQIVGQLYWPARPYAFEVVPADILGQVYERFLGRVIHLTASHRAKVEDKPELKRAGGVYYTPTYIVEYIVKDTIGVLLDGKNWKQAAKIRVLDPACGSGSFLLGAYEYLLNWYREQYIQDGVEKHKQRLYQTPSGWKLTISEKKQILLNNIYGVDIDQQAVEVTKLSLLLKVLEGESEQTAKPRLIKEPALPDLDKNIKCGNSLIGSEFYENEQMRLLDEEAKDRINVFDWEKGFPEVMSSGGFDAVIGNPPYRRELNFKHLMDEIAETAFGAKYRSPRMDLWYYFVHRALDPLLKRKGLLGFIVNAYWVAGTGAEKLIRQLASAAHIDEIFFLADLRVFRRVSGAHMILRITNSVSGEPTLVKRVPVAVGRDAEPFVTGKDAVLEYKKTGPQLFREGKIDLEPPVDDLLQKVEKGTPLGRLGVVRQGIAENPPSVTKKANLRFGSRWAVGEGVFALKPDELRRLKIPVGERHVIKPYYDLRDLGRYWIAAKPSLNLIYSTRKTWPAANDFPHLRDHLSRFRPIMDLRRETRAGTIKWWQLHWPREATLWTSKKIVSVQMAGRPSFVLTTGEVFASFSTNVFVKDPRTQEDEYYILALLNSKLLWKWFLHNAKRRGGLEINGNVLRRAPIRDVDFNSPGDVQLHDELCRLGEFMQTACGKLSEARTPRDRETLEPQIDATDRQIDRLVYGLYGLTEAEIEAVEDSLAVGVVASAEAR
jgi:Eco57I restriction-modification methylase